VYVQFPAGWNASAANFDSIKFEAIDAADGAVRHGINSQELSIGRAPGSPMAFIDTNADGVPDQIIVKFDRATVASWATGTPELVLRLEGQFQRLPSSSVGTYFSGDTEIRSRYHPN
jgi:hypothetical protein